MSKVEFKLDTSAVRSEILQADWMKDYIESVARQEIGNDEHMKVFIGFDRAKAIIYPNTKEYSE